MRLPPLLRFGLVLLYALLLQGLPCGASQPGVAPGAGGAAQGAPNGLHVHGTVVNGVTGKPIARALVTSSDRRLATMTDSQGAFALEIELENGAGQDGRASQGGDASRPGQVYLTAQRPDYLPQGMRPVAVSLDPSAEAAPVQLKLMPAATVTGHVFNEHNDAAHHVSVYLMFRSINNGERTWNRLAMHRTDADGSFQFGSLNPGEYTVMTEEWRGDNPLPPGRDAITEQYPPAYLGDAADLASALKLKVHFGENAPADLHLHTATYYPVSVPVTGNAEGFVNVRITGREAESGYHLGYVPGRHAVEGSLPNGTYGLELTSYPQGNTRGAPGGRGQAVERSYGIASLHIAGAAVRTAAVALTVPAPIAVHVHREFIGRDVPEHFGVRVYLQPVETGQPFVTASNEEGGGDEMTLPGAAPGQYSVHVEPSYGYPAQVRGGGVDLRAEKLTVSSGGSQAIDVVLRDDTATVEGTVKASSARGDLPAQPKPGGQSSSFVVLTPVNGDGKFNMTGTGPDGQFTMPNVAPGAYRLFAIDGGLWDSPYRDPEALRTLGDKGVAVTVTANARLQVDAPVLDAAALESK